MVLAGPRFVPPFQITVFWLAVYIGLRIFVMLCHRTKDGPVTARSDLLAPL